MKATEKGPEACNDPRDAMAVMYRNAQIFFVTREIPDAEQRRNAIRETYEEVCRFMRYYHGLAKKTGRNEVNDGKYSDC